MCPSVPLSVLRSTFVASARDSRPAGAGRRATTLVVPHAVSGMAGVWDGALYPNDGRAAASFSLLQSVSADAARGAGGVIGRVAFPGRDDSVAADVRLLEASATTYVALVGPYYDAAADAQVMLLLEARRSGDRMWGTYRVRRTTESGGRVADERCVDGRFVAVRSRHVAAA